MSTLRIFWILWCSFWALGWLLVGFLFFPVWIMVPVSLASILLPVGNDPRKKYTTDEIEDHYRRR